MAVQEEGSFEVSKPLYPSQGSLCLSLPLPLRLSLPLFCIFRFQNTSSQLTAPATKPAPCTLSVLTSADSNPLGSPGPHHLLLSYIALFMVFHHGTDRSLTRQARLREYNQELKKREPQSPRPLGSHIPIRARPLRNQSTRESQGPMPGIMPT